jgi:glycosyltransferase involved in cell wall biosynthesis
MASGVYTVLSAVGGNPKLLANGHLGCLVDPPHDLAAFAGALHEAVINDDLRRTIAAKARQAVVDNYSLELSTTRYLETYREALAPT